MKSSPFLGALRYLGSLGMALSIIALSVMFLVDMPTGDTARAAAVTVAAAEAAKPPRPERIFRASDLDISRSVAVNVTVPPDQPVEAIAPRTAPTAAPPVRVATVTTAANLRASPTRASPRVGGLKFGDQVEIVRAERGWTLIAGDGQHGWIATKFLAE